MSTSSMPQDPFTDGLDLVSSSFVSSSVRYEDQAFLDGEKDGLVEAYRNGYKFGAFQGWYIGTELGYAQSIAYTVLSTIASLYPEYSIPDIPNLFSILDPLSSSSSFISSSSTSPSVTVNSSSASTGSALSSSSIPVTSLPSPSETVSNTTNRPTKHDDDANDNTPTVNDTIVPSESSSVVSPNLPTPPLQRLIRTSQQLLSIVQQFPLHNHAADFDTLNEIQRIRAKMRVLIVTARTHLALQLDPDSMVTMNNAEDVKRNTNSNPAETGTGTVDSSVPENLSTVSTPDTTRSIANDGPILTKEKMQSLSLSF